MMTSFGMLALLLSLVTGGSNELLDYLPSDVYWANKKVEATPEAMIAQLRTGAAASIAKDVQTLGNADFAAREEASKRILALGPAVIPQLQKASTDADPEIATRANALVEKLTAAGQASAAQRLMAIRTLGEMKAKEALDVLRPLIDSKEPFVADYARRAIARIEGKEFASPGPAGKEMASDLALLPAGCGVVAQMRGLGTGEIFDLAKALDSVPGFPPEQK